MTKADTARLIAVIVMAYPNYDKFRDERHVENMVNAWAEFFSEDDSRIVALAIKKHVATSKWPPSIAEIRDIMTSIQNPDIIPTDEAWEAVAKVLYTQGEYCHADIYRLLPRPIAEAVDAIGYGQLYALHVAYARGHSGKAGLDRVAFTQAYEAKIERRREASKLPRSLREGIEAAQASFSDGSRAMLEETNRRYEEKKDSYRRLDYFHSSRLLEASHDDNEADRLAERQQLALEARYNREPGDEEDI